MDGLQGTGGAAGRTEGAFAFPFAKRLVTRASSSLTVSFDGSSLSAVRRSREGGKMP